VTSTIAKILVVGLMLVSPMGIVGATELDEDKMQAYYAAWSNGDVEAIMGYFGEDIVYADVPTKAKYSGSEAVRAFVQKFSEDYAGVKLTAASITIGTSSAAVEWVMSGGEGDQAWSVPGVCVFKLKNGLITSATDYWHKE
jgi:steroid delta-isomerase-like uncharacterized protein